jgi:hypothetical protein
MREHAKSWGQPTLSQGAISTRKNALPFAAAWTERAVPNFSPHPLSPARELTLMFPAPAKSWGQPTLSQGAISTRKNALPFAAAWTERAVPNFSPHPLSPARALTHWVTAPWRKPGASEAA